MASSRSCRIALVALVAAAVSIVSVGAAPVGSVLAAGEPVVTATSPTTGITYTGRYSCMEQRPSFVASRPSRLAYVKLEGVSGNTVTYSQAQYVDNRDLDSRVAFDVAGVPRETGTARPSFNSVTPSRSVSRLARTGRRS